MDIYKYAELHKDLLDQMPGYVQLNALDHSIAYVNFRTSQLIGFNKPEKVKGIHYYDMKCGAAEDHKIFDNQDTVVLTHKKKLPVFCYHSYREWTLALYEKAPLLDNKGKLIGLITAGMDITKHNLVDYSRFIIDGDKKFHNNKKKSFSYVIEDENINKYNLSDRQMECLFFLIRGKTDKDIANILKISPRTIESYIDSIKLKMGCLSRGQIIDKSYNEGLFTMIPKSFFSKI